MKSHVTIDRETGEIAITAQGNVYRLWLNTTAMIALEDLYSTPEKECPFEEAFNRTMTGGVRGLRRLMWCMAREYHPELREEDLNTVIDAAGGVMGLSALLEEARKSATPDAKDTDALGLNGSKNPLKAQVGKRTRNGGGVSTSTPAPPA